MKPLLICIPLMLAGHLLIAQSGNCGAAQSQIDLHANNIKARILNGGGLFTDLNQGQFIPNPDAQGAGPTTMYAAGLWIGALDPGGNLTVAAATHRNTNAVDYWPGPLNPEGQIEPSGCANWDRHFSVTGARIAEFLTLAPQYVGNPSQAIQDFPDIMGWPGIGNPYFTGLNGFSLPTQLLAPFVDTNGDLVYDPLDGDFPAVLLQNVPPFVPAQIIWCVFNDQGAGAPHKVSGGKALQIEVQLTAWAFNCPDEPVLNNAVFTSHKVINKSTVAYDSCSIGLWADMQIGCSEDDYVGSIPSLSSFYAYNADAIDGTVGASCGAGNSFGNNPPVQAVTFLNHPLDKFIAYSNTAGPGWPSYMAAPDIDIQFWNYLNGSWKDGALLTYGGTGYNQGSQSYTDFSFPTLPADPNGWSMCNSNLGLADLSVVGSHKIGQFLPGQVEELVTAWTVHENIDLPCGIGNTVTEVTSVREQFQNHFAGVCSPLTPVHAPANVRALEIFPNPANAEFTLRFGHQKISEIRLFAADGHCIRIERVVPDGEMTIGVAGLPNGLYTVQALGAQGLMVGKLTVLQ